MPDGWIEGIFTLPVFLYLFGVVTGQVVVELVLATLAKKQAETRRAAGLDEEVILSVRHAPVMERAALWRGGVLVGTVVGLPWIIWVGSNAFGAPLTTTARAGLVVVVLLMATALGVFGRDLFRAVIGGAAYRILGIFTDGIVVGQRISCHGVTGRVSSLRSLSTSLITDDGRTMRIPTVDLWHEPIVSDGAAVRCAMRFHPAGEAALEHRRDLESIVQEAAEASPHADPSHPVELEWTHTADGPVLESRVFVIRAEEAWRLRHDVTRACLDRCEIRGIPLRGMTPPPPPPAPKTARTRAATKKKTTAKA